MKIFSKDLYVPISFIGVLSVVIFFGADLRSSTQTNIKMLQMLNSKLEKEITILDKKINQLEVRINSRINNVEEEQKFVRERMIIVMNDLKREIYHLSGEMKILEKILDRSLDNKSK